MPSKVSLPTLRDPRLAAMPSDARPLVVSPDDLTEAIEALRRGGLVGFPTETVYGLGADALDPEAVRRIFDAKGRPADNPLIVHIADIDMISTVARSVSPLAADLAKRFWPGPLTLVLDAQPSVPPVTTGGHTTVGVRIPDHPVALALLAGAGLPVAAPSANRSGRPSPTTAAHVIADLGARVDVVVDGGPAGVGLESTVVDARGTVPIVLREGAVTREEIAAAAASGEAASPGTRYRHYAPACEIEIVDPAAVDARARDLAGRGTHVGVVAPSGLPLSRDVDVLARYDDEDDLARQLYATLRAGESAGCDVIVVASVPDRGMGRAVMDRLRRAAAG